MKISTVEQMRMMDRAAIDTFGIPDVVLMENAGNATYFVLHDQVGVQGRRFVIISGLGNNGGDGFVVARKLFTSGGDVRVFVLGDPDKLKGSARANFEILERSGVDIHIKPTGAVLEDALERCDCVVDAIFGTGLAREVSGPYAEAVNLINASKKIVMSVDIPSGVEGNTGRVLGVAVQANYTVTFGLPKRGNLLYPGAALGGKLYVTHISFPPKLQDNPELHDYVNIPPALPARRPDGHKGSFGDALFIAGARGYLGAPGLAGLSMLRAGGGYARLATPRSVVPNVATFAHELVFLPQPETQSGTLPLSCLDNLVTEAAKVDFVVLGPGTGLVESTQELVRELVGSIDKPLLIDGDGLSAVAENIALLSDRTAPTVLTPHPGEMARLTGVSVKDVLARPFESARELAVKTGAVVVLKGAHSIIATPHGETYVNPTGNSGMGTAGSGDVLAGTIAAMAGLGFDIVDAAKVGVFVHGLAGDLAARELGEDGMTARDIKQYLPSAMRAYRSNRDEIIANHYDMINVI